MTSWTYLALFAFEDFDFALRVDFRYSNTLVIIQIFWSQVVLVLEMCSVFRLRFGVKITFGTMKYIVIVDMIIEFIARCTCKSTQMAMK